ncbi:UvrD-helicase domain-containing protein (plasmid) [Rhizobium sp. CB3171]|uniref:UvrD-helicase domain-containing protein n=1 Tax=Rhizobium sp. CB3171 TaxID=3039157 RepID=UPI0024B0E1C8|nr:UvrD-helicase domain-containing protein [Rhizobium sp. CB3171]WFU07370.1 UvrD-helicase domain-containing protein [Rhizobium sp. CB3171]
MVTVLDVLQTRRGHVEAPAGCGKTELIAGCVAGAVSKPTLVLTHTTAGVAALRLRLQRANVHTANYRLNTIAGWAIGMVSMFPERASYLHDPRLPPNYPAIQAAVGRLCQSGHIDRELRATYGRLLVDEYQDCSLSQHTIVSGIANAIPTVVFGDPMQAIFGFGNDPLAGWHAQAAATFPRIGLLATPWRWNNAGAPELGNWLVAARNRLASGNSIDLRTCPNRIFWHPIGADPGALIAEQVRIQYDIARQFPNESVLIIGDSIQAQSRHDYASRAQGVSVVEPVDFPDVVGVAAQMTGQAGPDLLQSCTRFLATVMVNVYGDQIHARVQTIQNNRNRTPPTPQELAAITLANGGGYREAIAFLRSMEADRERRIYRHSAFNILIDCLSAAISSAKTPSETIAVLREQRRQAGRTVPMKAVGSTLLLKGLEANHVIILDADHARNPMTKEHLYVALSRGARTIRVFSRSPILP